MTKRADKKKNIDKVAGALIKDPLASEYKISSETGISQSAVNRAKKEVGKSGLVKDDRIISLTNKDFGILRNVQDELDRRTSDPDIVSKIHERDLNTIADSSSKRYSLFRGEATDKDGGTKLSTILQEIMDENE